MFPLVAISNRQTCVSVSTPEAELVAGSHGLLGKLVPALGLCGKLLPRDYHAVFHEDNQAMIRVIKSGRNPTMRYLHRTRRISMAVLHEMLTGKVDVCKQLAVEYTSSSSMAAGMLTKAFSDKSKWRVALEAINMFDRTAIRGQ